MIEMLPLQSRFLSEDHGPSLAKLTTSLPPLSTGGQPPWLQSELKRQGWGDVTFSSGMAALWTLT